MAQSLQPQRRLERAGSRGFTIIELLVSVFILIIGIISIAGLLGSMLGGSARSGYMNQAAQLASEKLEDLNRYPNSDPTIGAGGSLTSDVTNVTIPYYDEVYFSPSQGAVEETVQGVDSNGNPTYITTSFTPGGQITTSSPSSTPPSSTGQIAFERRWLIEANTPVNGVRRITVLVTLLNQMVQPPVTFQMSTVRP